MHKLPLEKSKGPWKKGKKISLPKSTTRITSLEEKITKNPLKYVGKFNIKNIKDDLIDELDNPIIREYFPGIVKPGTKFDTSSGETKEDLEFQAQIDEVENSTKETLVKAWVELNEKENPDKLKEEFYEIAYNIVNLEEEPIQKSNPKTNDPRFKTKKKFYMDTDKINEDKLKNLPVEKGGIGSGKKKWTELNENEFLKRIKSKNDFRTQEQKNKDTELAKKRTKIEENYKRKYGVG